MNILEEDINWSASCSQDLETSARINAAVSHNLRVLCREVVKTVPNLVSIYVTGSFAASEGAVLVEDNEIKLISDYDLLLITKNKLLTKALSERVFPDLKNVYVMPGHPIYEVFGWRLGKLSKLPPTKFLYDFKSAKCVFGVNLRPSFPDIKASDIPNSEGIRLIFNRAFGALIPFNPTILSEKLGMRKRRHLTFETVKLILGICDAMLIMQGSYFVAPKKDARSFKKELHCRLPQLSLRASEFDPLIDQALEYRIKPSIPVEKKALDLWFDSRTLLLLGLETSFKRLYGIRWPSLKEAVIGFVQRNPQSFALNGLITFNLLRKRKRFHSKALYKKPSNAILAIVLLLLFSIDREGNFDLTLLYAARELLAEHVGIRVYEKDPSKLWQVLKKYAVENYFDVFLPDSLLINRRLSH